MLADWVENAARLYWLEKIGAIVLAVVAGVAWIAVKLIMKWKGIR